MLEIDHFPSTLSYLNQITRLDIEGGTYDIHHWAANPDHIDNQPHKHSFFEVCYVVSGDGVYLEGEREYRLGSGDLFCSRPGKQHRIYKGRSLYLIWISFELNAAASSNQAIAAIERLAHNENYFVRNTAAAPSILAWQALLRQASKGTGLDYILRPLACGFVAALMNDFLSPADAEHKTSLPHDPQRIVQRAQTFVKDNLALPLRLKDVADYLHLSERTLSRLFHDCGGTTFVQYLKAERLRRAENLLVRTANSIKSIAEETGFESVHYFTRVFAETHGTPPGKFRDSSGSDLQDAH